MFHVLTALWLSAPVIAGGLLHIAAMRLNLLPSLARVPLDAHRTWRGRRWFGDNKTLRGLVLLVVFSAGAAHLQAWIEAHAAWAAGLDVSHRGGLPAWAWGGLLAAGYLAGELPNSFVKRQLDIAPGAPARGWLRPCFWVIDQVDSLAGGLAAVSLVWTPPWALIAAGVGVTLVIHPLVAALMKTLGLKSRVG